MGKKFPAHLRKYLIHSLSCFTLFISCAPLGESSSSSCQDSSGNSVDVKSPFGKWKKISGYEQDGTNASSRSEASLKLNYDVLIVEMGAILCSTRVVNGTQAASVYKAAYEHDVDKKNLNITYLAGDYEGSEQVTYSFSGTCSEPKMTISHSDTSESPETYVLISKNVEQDDCQVTTE